MPTNTRSKYRGSKTCGGGTHKNRRGAGNRGGKGRAGHRDHRWTHFLLAGEVHNGKHGFVSVTKTTVPVLDVGDVDQMVDFLLQIGIAEEEEGVIALDLTEIGVEKVLGGGQVTRALKLTAAAFSAQAKDKIEAAGGQALTD
ncbi:50S ribosomal protein L15 [Methanofollis formosanus]|uniref:Large ribosomal subunit protein uL15 n=1 Tax=Methanofollis formosanus TaxID=299308 RepID=A0A8G1EGM6_9EURY|nr:uL15 family ribosomal protein [Methanofollis formosanus]QYZ79082.1 50S ribosomal protein L15 [Methanofollis formosanus]